MANYSFWAIGESELTVSGGGQLDGVTQGDGSHLLGLSITLNSYDFEEISVRDRGRETNFDDNDSGQVVRGRQEFDGISYRNNTVIEAEYRIVLRDPDTGEEYEAISINFNTSSPAYGTVEGLAFVDVIPPAGVALEVIETSEGPGSNGQGSIDFSEIAAPACFTPGTLIDTPFGPRPVEALRLGDLVLTRDSGPQPLIWVGQTMLSASDLMAAPHARPILIRKDAFGAGRPCRDMRVSPQHRILIAGPDVELLFGEPEVLAAASHLIDGKGIVVDVKATQVMYLHLQCARHEVLISDGLPTESYNPGAQSALGFAPEARNRLQSALRRALEPDGPTLPAARPMIKRHEAATWQAAA